MINKINKANKANSSRKYGKNRKAGWRRNINIEDIEELLQAQRKDDILDGTIASKSSSDLFELDTGSGVGTDINDNERNKDAGVQEVIEINDGDEETPKITETSEIKGEDDVHKKDFPTKSERKLKAIKKKHLTHEQIMKKCYPLIDGMPGAKCQPTRSQAAKPARGYEGRYIKIKYKERKPPKFLETMKKNIDNSEQQKLIRPKSNRIMNYDFDLWADKETEKETFMREIKQHYMTETKKMPHVMPKSAKDKPSMLPSVPAPHPGASYNPTFSDHQKLLGLALRQESSKIKKEDKINEKFYRYLPTRANAPTAMTWIHEMSEGLPEKDEKLEEEEEEEEEKGEEKSQDELYTKVMLKPKSTDKRKKKKEKRAVGIAKFKERVKEYRENKIKNVDSYITEFEIRDDLLKRRAEKKAKVKELEALRVKRISKGRFQDEDIAVTMEDELSENLLGVKPAQSLLLEHFKHMQRRNMVHSRHQQKKKRKMKKKKTQIKRSFRIDEDDMNSIKKLNN